MMVQRKKGDQTRPKYIYQQLPANSTEDGLIHDETHIFDERRRRRRKRQVLFVLIMFAVLTVLGFGAVSLAAPFSCPSKKCDTVSSGYQCNSSISHSWGQYSPYYTVPSEISADIPPTCSITFAQILSRHGARDPTASKTTSYNATIAKIQANVDPSSYTGDYAFLSSYEYTLGADQLTTFGQQEMVNSGIKFFKRYEALAATATLFVRSSGEARVVESALNWTQGYHQARSTSPEGATPDGYPYNIVVISEAAGSNNTLNHDLCTDFENGSDSTIAKSAQSTWSNIFIPPIMNRLNEDLPGANLTASDTISMMDLCPFNTVASPTGAISPFCNLFTQTEWQQYDYYETLGKFYGFGSGNPLGPTQGVGFTNELLARLTGTPVNDETSSNHTLDSNPATFPLKSENAIYADFSHDNDMTSIFFALGLYNSTSALSKTSVETTQMTNGYSASYTVPFAARAYFEKMTCGDENEELVRVIVNDRVIPLQNCGADSLGRCTLTKFVESQGFAQMGGRWGQCFV